MSQIEVLDLQLSTICREHCGLYISEYFNMSKCVYKQ